MWFIIESELQRQVLHTSTSMAHAATSSDESLVSRGCYLEQGTLKVEPSASVSSLNASSKKIDDIENISLADHESSAAEKDPDNSEESLIS